MAHYSAAVLAVLLTVATAGAAAAQTSSVDKSAAPTTSPSTAGDKAKGAESARKDPAAAGTVDVSPGVGAIEGADGKPPLPSKGGK